MKLVTGAQMAEIDRRTIHDYGLGGEILMETAGRAVSNWLHRRGCQRVAFLCGPGNNGGDGLVAARAFAERGGRPQVFLLAEPERYSGEAAANLRRAEAWQLPLRPWSELPSDWNEYDFVVDALFGTGLKRSLEAPLQAQLQGLPRRRTLAVDIPSGLDSASGQPLGGFAVRAVTTLTFGLPKLGQVLQPGPEYCGEVEVVSIGFPPALLNSDEWPGTLVTAALVRQWIPQRDARWHKGKSGRVLLLAGSVHYPGAALLCALGALRGGAGLVYVCVPPELVSPLMAVAPEAIPVPRSRLEDMLGQVDAWCVGPGLGPDEDTLDTVRSLLAKQTPPVVVDADALRALPERPGASTLLTPHHGELARLLRSSATDIERDRLGAALRAARQYGAAVLLKGAPTLVVTAQGGFLVSDTGTPVLAQGGSGDVLSGLAAALLAEGLSCATAGAAAAYLHGLAGRLGEVPAGLGARNLAELLPQARARVERD